MQTFLPSLLTLSPYFLLLVFVLGLVGILVLVRVVCGQVKPGQQIDLDVSWRGVRLSVSKGLGKTISFKPQNKGDPPNGPIKE